MPRRILEGKVVSDKMDKTVTVLVERRTMHPVYRKYIRKSDKYAAHDEANAFRVGDVVQIEECRPISRRKSWKVITAPSAEAAARVKAKAAEAKADTVAAAKPKKEKAAKPAAAKKTAAKKPAKKES